ncbi:deoxyribose-phosphate aldolase [uncultured Roseovarius sp.]|uniref:deoxyribose-phosphate aldolase n=1 Tax=uncultured Roseovarius sp. TaxID=293344 RepID=UPI0025F36954|nr:deoxyribose-phosphate aldolase [uncultured Roseovarius sp.]
MRCFTDIAPPPLATDYPPRNPGQALDLGWLDSVQVDDAAMEAETAEIDASCNNAGTHHAAWLLRAIQCMDLTTLSGDDTPERVEALCQTARAPLPAELAEKHGAGGLTVGAVCVYHAMIPTALAALDGTGIPVAAVSAGFPAGLSSPRARVAEVEDSTAAGATEIDIVIPRYLALSGDWPALYEDIRALRRACGDAHLKCILSVGELGDLTTVARTSLTAMMAGADVVKTSTGKEATNATLPAALTMLDTIEAYHQATGHQIGFKPAGGISTARAALPYMAATHARLGPDWLQPTLFRFGASSLLKDIRATLAAS